ncbi:MAG: formate/nitrite transporter family protein, partial [Nitrososphaerota archaeon]
QWAMGGGEVGLIAVRIAAYKTSLTFTEAFFKGVLCNILVCLAVWLAMAGRSVIDKIAAIVFPISAFVAAGFEHSIANMYFIPMGILLKTHYTTAKIPYIETLDLLGFAGNLVPVTLGNIIGGSVMVGLVYWLVYRRSA